MEGDYRQRAWIMEEEEATVEEPQVRSSCYLRQFMLYETQSVRDASSVFFFFFNVISMKIGNFLLFGSIVKVQIWEWYLVSWWFPAFGMLELIGNGCNCKPVPTFGFLAKSGVTEDT